MEANHRGSSFNDPSTSEASPYLHDAAAGGTGRPTAVHTEHRRDPEPRHAKSALRVTPLWRESLSNLGFHGPYLQLHLSTPGHTSEGLQALGPLRESFLRMQAKDHANVMRVVETMEGASGRDRQERDRSRSPSS